MDKEKTLRKLKQEIEEVREKFGVEFAEVKHGEWEDFSSIWECDQCHKWFSLEQGTADMNYCPNCGADMRGGNDG